MDLMARKHTFELKGSGFQLNAEGEPIGMYQALIGRPQTGRWCVDDEYAYIEHLTNQMWKVLRIATRLPKNWEFSADV
jgi:hypothetical protein